MQVSFAPGATAPTAASAMPTQLERQVLDGMRADQVLDQVKRIGGPRVAGTADAKRAAELIRDQARAHGWDAKIEPEAMSGIPLFNVVAERAGTAPDGERGLVLAGAHLDSVRGAPGANDDASGSAALLEAAKVFSTVPTRHDLRFVWFDGEERGMLGSRAYVSRHKDELRGAKAMVIGEMLGSPAGRPSLVFTDRASATAAKLVEDAAARADITPRIEVDPRAGSDHLPFAGIGIPSVVVASTVPRTVGREDPNYHRPSDTPDKLNLGVMEQSADLFGLAINAYANGT